MIERLDAATARQLVVVQSFGAELARVAPAAR
jgi:hypothetical protein